MRRFDLLQNIEFDCLATELSNYATILLAFAIKDVNLLTVLQTQNIARVAGFCSTQRYGFFVPRECFGWRVESSTSHNLFEPRPLQNREQVLNDYLKHHTEPWKKRLSPHDPN